MSELLDLGETRSPSPYLKWKNAFIEKHGVITHLGNNDIPMEVIWCAFVGGWDHLAEYCSIMEGRNEMRYGKTEREALDKIALAVGYPTIADELIKGMI